MTIKFWNCPICRKVPGAVLHSHTYPPHPPVPAVVLTLASAWGLGWPWCTFPALQSLQLAMFFCGWRKPSQPSLFLLFFFPFTSFCLLPFFVLQNHLLSLASRGFILSTFPACRTFAFKVMVPYRNLYDHRVSPVIATAGPPRTQTQELPSLLDGLESACRASLCSAFLALFWN